MVLKRDEDVVIIERSRVNDSALFKSNYDRFIMPENERGLFHTLRKVVNRLQAGAYAVKPTLCSKITMFFYTPAPKICRGGHLLDIGCSSGNFMANLEKIWKAEGIEINTKACRIARNKGLSVRNCDVMELQATTQYDLIRCSHIYEHINDPENFNSKVVSILNKGGLLIIYTPNLDSMTRKIFGDIWEGYYDETHFRIYGKAYFLKMATIYGLEVRSVRSYYMGYNISTVVRLLRINSKVIRSFLSILMLVVCFPFELLLSKAGWGDALYIELKKT